VGPLTAALVLAAWILPTAPAGAVTDVEPYRGLGSWVDAFDYAPRLQANGAIPPVTADSVGDMARLGVRTLYLQVGNPDGAPDDRLTDEPQLREILVRARAAGLRVVAWFLPSFADPAADSQMIATIVGFRSGSARFDAVALDLEDTRSVTDVGVRNDRMVDLVRTTRALLGSKRALGAIVYPAVQTDVINPLLWPNFPYKRLAPSVDVWLPMAYFTFRSVDSGYRDAFRFTDESVTRLRKHLDNDRAAVHVIGGIADSATPADYVSFLRAARATKALGYSVYDFNTTASSAWPYLRGESQVASP
jgi:hypothetical protein